MASREDEPSTLPNTNQQQSLRDLKIEGTGHTVIIQQFDQRSASGATPPVQALTWTTGPAQAGSTTACPPANPATLQPNSPVEDLTARNELTDLLKRRFRQSERESLLFRLGLHPEDVKLRPEDREEFARAMVLHIENVGRLADLWDEVYRAREVFLRGRRNPFR